MTSAPQTVHGGLDLAELRQLGINAADVLDFSASINPIGPPSGVWEAMRAVNLATYPDRECIELRDRLATRLDVDLDSILIGNGSTELIHLIAQAFLGPGDTAVVFTPTFGEYEAACRVAGAIVIDIHAGESNLFNWDLASARETIRTHAPKLVFLCNPNNPTGVYLEKGEIIAVSDAIGEHGVLVLDEAYVPFVRNAWDSRSLLDVDNIVVLHSMTKDYALTGLRVGYMIAGRQIVDVVGRHQISWSVNSLAQAATIAALDHPEHVEKGREIVESSKAYLVGQIEAMGLSMGPSAANFVIAKVGDAADVRRKLLARGVCVRDCASFGLPEYIRIGVRSPDDCARLVESLREVMLDA